MPLHEKTPDETLRIEWRIPVITAVLAATAIPVELRAPGMASLAPQIDIPDMLANLAGYLPVGLVFGKLGMARALTAAALISCSAEASQFLMMHRFPSVIDVATNVLGAFLGAAISRRWRIVSPASRVDRGRALVAAALALGLVLAAWTRSGPAPSERGLSVPGGLEAHWKFDESSGNRVIDSSGHGLHGEFRHRPERLGGVLGRAVRLDGEADCIDFGRSTALRLAGDMSISAWIRPDSFPVDDAVIVSGRGAIGYQLDTTVDQGPRTIGFKLTGACGQLMARYGETPLLVGKWYHVAGVYSAAARTLDVYLDGKPDNGILLGEVSDWQRSSRGTVYAGRRSDSSGFEFPGSIDDLRIYSVALTRNQIGEVMLGADIEVPARPPVRTELARSAGHGGGRPGRDRLVYSDPEDARLPALAVTLGILAAVASAGLPSRARRWPCLAVSPAVGLLLPIITTSNLPVFNFWLLPLTALAGAAAVAVSLPSGKVEGGEDSTESGDSRDRGIGSAKYK